MKRHPKQVFALLVTAVLLVTVPGWLLYNGEKEPVELAPPVPPQLAGPTVTPPPTSPVPLAGSSRQRTAPTLLPATPIAPTPTLIIATPTLAPSATVAPTASPTVAVVAESETTLARLTLAQKVAQMVMVGVPGPTVDEVVWRRVAEQGVGGVILLPRNIQSATQVYNLTTQLQQTAQAGRAQVPLFIAWNHEGGDIVRTRAGLTLFPSNRALGAVDDPALTYSIGRAVGVEMQHLGVNMNYAPVLDVNVEQANPIIGLRAYGEEPGVVARHGIQFITGQQEAGVIAVAKHFPGHGRVDVDSHVRLPTLNATMEELALVEIPPFEAALAAGVGAVMVAHLNIPAMDATGRPSTLSPAIVTGLLRQQLGYEGVVMTDDLGMGAIANHYTIEEAAIQAVEAGNDLLLMVEPYRYPDRVINALVSAVSSGRLTEERIDLSVRRLLQLKQHYLLNSPSDYPLPDSPSAHQELALGAGEAAVQVVRNEAAVIPLPETTDHLLLISPVTMNPGSTRGDWQSGLAEEFRAKGVAVTEFFYDPQVTGSPLQLQNQARQALRGADAGIIVLWDSVLHYQQRGDAGQEQLVDSLLNSRKPVVVVSGHLPYDGARLPAVPTLINLYGDSPGQLRRLVHLLFPGR